MAGTTEVKLGIVACGGISHAHGVAAERNAGQVRFAACCDIVENRAKAWAEQYGCSHSYTDFREMLAQEDLDAVVLATWPNQHREQIEACLAAGQKNILCEKELTLTGAEAMEVYELVREAGAFLMEAFMYRHHPAIVRLEELVAAGEAGEVDNVRACFTSFDPEVEAADNENRNWRQRKECGGGIPYDFACYCVNACRLFADGIPKRLVCYGGVSEKYDTINRMFALIEYDNGRIGLIESSKSGAFSEELQISGSKAILNLPVAWTIPEEIAITRGYSVGWADLRHETFPIPPADSYALQLRNFADVVRGQAKPVLPLAESVVNAYTLEAMVNSLLENREIEPDIPKVIKKAMADLKGAK